MKLLKKAALFSGLFVLFLSLLVTLVPAARVSAASLDQDCDGVYSCIVVKLSGDTSDTISVTATNAQNSNETVTLKPYKGDKTTYFADQLFPNYIGQDNLTTAGPNRYIWNVTVKHNGKVVYQHPTEVHYMQKKQTAAECKLI